jgi:hypothetical protein
LRGVKYGENTRTPQGDLLRVRPWPGFELDLFAYQHALLPFLFKLLLKRDEQSVCLITVQTQSIVCEIGCLVIIGKEIDAAITHHEKGVSP